MVVFIHVPFISALAEDDKFFSPELYSSGEVTYRAPSEGRQFFSDRLTAARDLLVLGYPAEAIDAYKSIIGNGLSYDIEPEYAYALALSGYFEPAMGYLDDCHIHDPSATGPYFYAGRVLAFAGYGDLARDFNKLASGDTDFYSDLASKSSLFSAGFGIVSCADADGDFKKDLKFNQRSGAVILNVMPGARGVMARDIVTQINGADIKDAAALKKALDKAGNTAQAAVWRAGSKLTVRLSRLDPGTGLPSLKGSKPSPDNAADIRLTKAVTFLSDKKYFSAILAYRSLIEDYPDWVLPYLGYCLALEKAGDFDGAGKGYSQAMAAAPDVASKKQLKAESAKVEAISPRDRAAWRQGQSVETFAERPSSFYLGFGGAQLAFGGSTGFKFSLNGRFGMLWANGEDLSVNLGIDTSRGVTLSGLGTLRYYLNKDYSVNIGASAGIDTSGPNVSVGLLGGGSWYYEEKSSLDMMINLKAYLGSGAKAGVEFYIGTTRYI